MATIEVNDAKRRGSVRGRILFTIAGSILLVEVLILGFSALSQRETLVEHYVFQASIVARTLSGHQGDPEVIAAAVAALREDSVVSIEQVSGARDSGEGTRPPEPYRITDDDTLVYRSGDLEITIDISSVTPGVRAYVFRIAGLIILIVLFVTATTYLALRPQLVAPLRRLEQRMNRIAGGETDLTDRISLSRNDEMGRIAHSFDAFSDHLLDIVVSIKQTAEAMLEGAGTLSETSHATLERVTENSESVEETKNRLTDLNQSITGVAGSVERITSSIGELDEAVYQQSDSLADSLAAVEQMDASIRSLDSVVHNNKDLTDTLVSLAHQAAEQMEGSVNSIATVESSTEDMLEMIDVVNTVADQTNLLAMNAAIEAAHAGEYGKGFAVVADEIQNLSVLSSENAQKINRNLRQDVESIHRAGEVNRAAQDAFERIVEHVGTVADGMSQILASLDEQATASREIVNGFSTIRTVTDTVRSGTEGIGNEAAAIKSEIDSVSESSAYADERMVTVAGRIAGIRDAISQINEIVGMNQDRMQRLIGILEQFRTDPTARP